MRRTISAALLALAIALSANTYATGARAGVVSIFEATVSLNSFSVGTIPIGPDSDPFGFSSSASVGWHFYLMASGVPLTSLAFGGGIQSYANYIPNVYLNGQQVVSFSEPFIGTYIPNPPISFTERYVFWDVPASNISVVPASTHFPDIQYHGFYFVDIDISFHYSIHDIVFEDVTPTPIPASAALFASALGALGFAAYRRRRMQG